MSTEPSDGLRPDKAEPISDVCAGKAVFISEVCAGEEGAVEGASVRVVGKLRGVDSGACTAVLADAQGRTLDVSTELLSEFPFASGALFMFIGELAMRPASRSSSSSSSSRVPVLVARVARNVDGIDLQAHDKTLLLKRKFEAKISGSGPQ